MKLNTTSLSQNLPAVAQVGNLLYRRLVVGWPQKCPTAADCQSATQQTASLRYGSGAQGAHKVQGILPRWATVARFIVALALMLSASQAGAAEDPHSTNAGNARITVASYYFGQYHPNDPRNLKTRGKALGRMGTRQSCQTAFPRPSATQGAALGLSRRIQSASHGAKDRRRR
ncbi:MAG: hypothetical protein V9H26_20955 [Verrucomicrobiota bacterium]